VSPGDEFGAIAVYRRGGAWEARVRHRQRRHRIAGYFLS